MILECLLIFVVMFISFYLAMCLMYLAEWLGSRDRRRLHTILTGQPFNQPKDNEDYPKEPKHEYAQIPRDTNHSYDAANTQSCPDGGYTRYYGEYIYDIPFHQVAALVVKVYRILHRLTPEVKRTSSTI